MKLKVGESDGAGSRTYRKLTFTNTSAKACRLKGAPQVEASSDSGAITRAKVEGDPTSFVVQPGGRAESTLSVGSAGAYSDCKKQKTDSIQIWMEGQNEPGADPTSIRQDFEFCTNMAIMSVTPYKPA